MKIKEHTLKKYKNFMLQASVDKSKICYNQFKSTLK